MNMRRARFVQPFLNSIAGEIRPITIATQMTEINMLEFGRNKFGEDIRGCIVGKMPVPAENTLFNTPRPPHVILQQLHIVIRFQNKDVRLANAFHHELCGVTEIGQKTDITTVRSQHITDRIISVMRDGERFDPHTPDFERRAGAEQPKIEFRFLKLQFNRFLGEPVAVNGNRQLAAQCAETVGMIGVLMSEQNARKTFRRPANLRQAFADLSRAEPGIDQEPGIASLEVGTITVGTAAKNRELNRH